MTAVIVSVPHSGTHWLKERLGAKKALHCDPGGGWRRAMSWGDIHVPLRDPLLSCITRKARTGIDDIRVPAACFILVETVAPLAVGFHHLHGERVNATPPHYFTADDVPVAMEALLAIKATLVPFYESHGVELSWS